MKTIKDKIKENPMSQALPDLYSDTRNDFCKEMSPESKSQFLLAVGKFSDVASSLYNV